MDSGITGKTLTHYPFQRVMANHFDCDSPALVPLSLLPCISLR